MDEGFYFDKYGHVVYLFKSREGMHEFWMQQESSGVSPALDSFTLIQDPISVRRELMKKKEGSAREQADFIESKLEQLKNPPKANEYTAVGADPYNEFPKHRRVSLDPDYS